MSMEQRCRDLTRDVHGETVSDQAARPEMVSRTKLSEMVTISRSNQRQALPMVTKMQIQDGLSVTVRGRPAHHAAT